jgi:hypothetical protein
MVQLELPLGFDDREVEGDCSECPDHDCWDLAKRIPKSTVLCCAVCGAVFDHQADGDPIHD